MLHVELIDVLGALNGDFKQRKKDSMPLGLVSHVGDILVHRVHWLFISLFLTGCNSQFITFNPFFGELLHHVYSAYFTLLYPVSQKTSHLRLASTLTHMNGF